MVLNYIKEEQIAFGQIEARKIYVKLNNAEMHIHEATPLLKIREYGSQNPRTTGPTLFHLLLSCRRKVFMDVNSQPSNERKRLGLPDATRISAGTKRWKEHLDRYVTRPAASDLITDADVNKPAV